jgi:hypothetical protein
LIFVNNSNSRFEEVEGFIIYTDGNPATAVTKGFQAKRGDKNPKKSYLMKEGAVLLNGKINKSKPKRGWEHYTVEKVKDLLGISLQLAMPRGMLGR